MFNHPVVHGPQQPKRIEFVSVFEYLNRPGVDERDVLYVIMLPEPEPLSQFELEVIHRVRDGKAPAAVLNMLHRGDR